LMLKTENRLAQRQNIQLNVTPEARRWLLAQNDQPEFGARPLRRIISRHLREPLANFLLSQSRPERAVVEVHAGNGALQFEFAEAAPAGEERA
ncbi:MAG TPA: hypothetical protein VK879_11940, partial [Candidatus Sulfomarinibacteraceae bacterium]|nr:hypothetical protein [Candidatus Sulfomarinibacteraceae bacterium]